MKNKPLMVMPAIYRFTLKESPEKSQWGWHRAVEVVEAINNILVLKGEKVVSPREINNSLQFTILGLEWISYVDPSMEIYGGDMIGGIDWLQSLVCKDFYFPAKIGMQLLDRAKRPPICKV